MKTKEILTETSKFPTWMTFISRPSRCKGKYRSLGRNEQKTMLGLATMILILLLPGFGEASLILNENGGYGDLIVSIGKEVPPIACQQLIQNIQGIFTGSSDFLRRATDGRVYFQRVVIVVPPMWDTRACGRALPGNSFTSRASINDATIRIGTEHPVFGHLPWTQQARSCGLPGDFISVGYHYILQYNETDTNGVNNAGPVHNNHQEQQNFGNVGGKKDKPLGFDFSAVPAERAFVHEWAKLRYGVFEEIGFSNDPIYPTSYTEGGDRKPTACTNHLLHGNWSTGCDESSRGSSTSNNNGNCTFSPATHSHDNDRVTSSIMSFPQGRNIRLFCDASNHNTRAPTKQNFLCERKSTAEVIYDHPDIRSLPYREPNVVVPPPEFIVKQITQPKFVLLVEETGNMNLRDVWKFLKLAVRKFIKYDLATGTQIGLVAVSTNEVRVLANMTSLQSLTLRRALADKLPNYPNVDSGGNISLRRGIFQAVEVLKRNQQRAAGSVIILISQGTVSTVDLEASLELLREEEVTLAAIEYPSLGDGKIALLSGGTNGPHFEIRETGVGPTTHLGTYMHLINALMTIQRFYTEDVASNWPTMIHQMEYKGDSRSYIESNFSFESTASQSPAEFFIYTSNPNDPKINSVELTSPNGVKFTTQLSDLHDINVIKIDAIINEPGVWRYRIERLADSHQSHFVQVVTKTSSEDLTVRLYSNVNVDKVANLSFTPLILLTEVKRKNSPVIDADVEALIVTGNKKWTVRLLDNGNGDPDVTGGDGIYSRYFVVPSGVSTSQLEVSARVIVNPYRAKFIVVNQDPLSSQSSRHQPCCGSFLAPADPKQQYKLVPFGERSTNTLSIRITDIPVLGFYPPGRIGDLRLGRIEPYDRRISLHWTAPGEDFDQGVPASYQVFYSIDNYNEEWRLLAEFTADLEAGVEDNATVTLPMYGSFLIAMGAVDFYAKVGKMSNIVKVTLYMPPKDPPSTYSPNHVNTLGITNTTPPTTEELTKLDLLLIILCAVVFILLLSGLIVLLLYCRKLGSSHRKSTKNSGEGKIAAITDSKSPIHWSASELLGEHEKRHSLYGGSISPGGNSNTKQTTQNGGHGHPMHLSIVQTGVNDYNMAGSSPSRRTSSPDSYDDPESPAPVPVSVRNRSDYDAAARVAMGYNTQLPQYTNHYQTPQSHINGGFPPHFQQQQHQHQHPQFLGSNRLSMNSGVSNSSPLPPLHHNNSSSSSSHHQHNIPQQQSHLTHYEPDIQGSLSSVNSKKRNITMV